MSLVNGLHHVSIKTCEFDKTIEFYTKTLGFPIFKAYGEGTGRCATLDTGNGTFMEIFANGTPDIKPEGSIHHFAFLVDDVDLVIKNISDAGGTVTVKPMDYTAQTTPPSQLRLGFVKGPNGELIEFFYEK